MNIISFTRTMDKRLRVMLISTALLLLPAIGLLMAWSDTARGGRDSDLAIFFKFTAIFIVPTGLILTTALLDGLRQSWRSHKLLAVTGLLNLVLAFGIIWFLVRH